MSFNNRPRTMSGLARQPSRTLPRWTFWDDTQTPHVERWVKRLAWVVIVETSILAGLLLIWGLDHVG